MLNFKLSSKIKDWSNSLYEVLNLKFVFIFMNMVYYSEYDYCLWLSFNVKFEG
jgi:hypothetical protein